MKLKCDICEKDALGIDYDREEATPERIVNRDGLVICKTCIMDQQSQEPVVRHSWVTRLIERMGRISGGQE